MEGSTQKSKFRRKAIEDEDEEIEGEGANLEDVMDDI